MIFSFSNHPNQQTHASLYCPRKKRRHFPMLFATTLQNCDYLSTPREDVCSLYFSRFSYQALANEMADRELHASLISKITMASQGHEIATVSAEEYNAIFGRSDSESDEGGSDIDLLFSEDESESSENIESEEEQDEDDSSCTDHLTNIEVGDFVLPIGILLGLSHEAKEVDLFKLLFDDGIIEHIVMETNCYAQQKLSENPQRLNKWREVTTNELKVYFGVCIIMGINSLPSTADYWSADQYIGDTEGDDERTYARSMVHVDRKRLPSCSRQKLRREGEILRMQKRNLVYTKWHDKRDVNILSSNVDPFAPPVVKERRKKNGELV